MRAGLYAWYAVQIHQTKYLTEIGVSATEAAWALGLVSLLGVPGQIIFGHVSDRIGREWVWAIGCAGFVICYLALIALQAGPTPSLLYAMVLAQGFLGYSMTSVLGPIVAEIYEGPHFGTIFGSVMLAAIGGGAAGPWLTGRALRPHRQLHRRVLARGGSRPGLGRRRVHGRAAQGAAGCGADAEMISAQGSARGRAEKRSSGWAGRNDRAVPCGCRRRIPQAIVGSRGQSNAIRASRAGRPCVSGWQKCLAPRAGTVCCRRAPPHPAELSLRAHNTRRPTARRKTVQPVHRRNSSNCRRRCAACRPGASGSRTTRGPLRRITSPPWWTASSASA